MLLDCLLYLRPETMAIKKPVRSVDLMLQFIITLQEQLLHQLCAIVGLFQRALQWQRIKSKPNLCGIAIYFMDCSQQRDQRRGPCFLVVLIQKCLKRCFSVHVLLDQNFSG